MNNLRYTIYIVILIAFVGCVSAPSQLKANSIDVKNILTVYVEASPKLPTSFEYYSPESSHGATIGGVIGSLITQLASETDGASLESYVINNNISLGQLYLDSFSRSILRSEKLQLTSDSNNDTKLSLEIIEFGFIKGWGISNVKPLIKVRAKLFNSKKVLWEETESISGWTSETASRPIDEWLEDPVRFKKDIAYAFLFLSQLQLQSL